MQEKRCTPTLQYVQLKAIYAVGQEPELIYIAQSCTIVLSFFSIHSASASEARRGKAKSLCQCQIMMLVPNLPVACAGLARKVQKRPPTHTRWRTKQLYVVVSSGILLQSSCYVRDIMYFKFTCACRNATGTPSTAMIKTVNLQILIHGNIG